FSATEAEELRRAFGFKRSERLMAEVEMKLRAGMARQGIHGAAAEEIVHAITAFALYGFPESHASSFALLAYASAYLRVHHPAAFYAALLNNQPMGFYHPATIVKDAQRHGLRILPINVTCSQWLCTVEPIDGTRAVMRMGLRYVKGLRERVGRAIVEAREARVFGCMHDLARRAHLDRDPMTLRRAALRRRGVLSARELGGVEDGARIEVAGSVIVRQRPGTAKGFVFLSLEDETGISNVIVTPPVFARHRLALVSEPYLVVDGIAQRHDGVPSVRAIGAQALPALGHHVPSHDFG